MIPGHMTFENRLSHGSDIVGVADIWWLWSGLVYVRLSSYCRCCLDNPLIPQEIPAFSLSIASLSFPAWL